MRGFRYIDWSEYGRLAEALSEKVRSGGERFDLVIGVARGGIPVAMVVADRLGVVVDMINVKSYSDIGKRSKPRILSTVTERIAGKRILLVDDLVDQGDTLEFLKRRFLAKRPRSLSTAVLFKKPWSRTEPDYFLESVDKWVVFPFEVGEVGRERSVRTGRNSPDSHKATASPSASASRRREVSIR